MQTGLRKGMKRLCGMMLAAVLSLTGILPAFAAENGKVVGSAFDPEVGDILQPGDVITLRDWEPYENVAYFDYTESGLYLDYSGVMKHSDIGFYQALDNHRYESDRLVIKEYKRGDKALDRKPERLNDNDFGGWMVMARRAETISSGNYGYLILMAVPKRRKTEVTCISSAKIAEESSVPEGAGVVLYSYDLKTGKLRKSDENGTLKVSPGDVVYAVSKPAMKHYSAVEILGPDGLPIQDQVRLLEWNTKKTGEPLRDEYRPELPSFIPADEADAVTVFVAPFEDVTVSAGYKRYEKRYFIAYTDYESRGDLVPLHDELWVWFNEKIKIWNPVGSAPRYQGESDGSKTFLFWKRLNEGSYMGEYYLANESLRVCEDYVLDIRDRKSSTCEVKTENTPYTAYFYNRRGDVYSTVQADLVQDEDILLVPDPAKIPAGKSLTSIKYVASGVVGTDEKLGWEGSVVIRRDNFDPDAKELTVTASYEENPKDLIVDLTEDYSLSPVKFNTQSPFVSGMESLRYAVNCGKIAAAKTLAFPAFLENNPYASGYTNIDLNGDGIGDVRLYSGYIDGEATGSGDMDIYEWKHLDGAKLCENSYDFPIRVNGLGTVTVKLFSTCKVTYFDGDKTITGQEVRKGLPLEKPAANAAVKKAGYTFKGWSTEKGGNRLYDFSKPVTGDLNLYAVWEKTVAVNDVVKDEKTGNTFVVTATGEKNEVSLKEAAVKKGTVTVPDVIRIGGTDYKVTAIEKAAFSKASSMKTLIIGENVAGIRKGFLKKCKKLKVIKIRNKKKVLPITKNMFGKFKGKITLKVPKKMVKKYKQYLKKKKLTKYFKVTKG